MSAAHHRESEKVVIDCAQEVAIATIVKEQSEHARELSDLAQTTDKTYLLLVALNKKLFESDGKNQALLPELQTRLQELEKCMIPHDDLHDVVRDYKLGRKLLFYLSVTAAVGGAAILFWHLFQLTTPQPKVTP